MNNFELDRRAKELAASNSGYNLARRFLMLEDQLADARREADQLQQAQGKAVAEVLPNFVGVDFGWCDPWNKPPVGTKLYAHPLAPAAVPEVTETAKRRAGLFLDSLHSDGCNEVKTLRNLLAAAPAPEDPQ